MKKMISILLMLFLLTGSAFASSVTYEDQKELFEFKPGSVYEETDLFEDFKGVMPGDVRTEIITVQNKSEGQVRIWLQCKYDSHVETNEKDFLDQLMLTVENGGKTLFKKEASEKAQLSNPVLLGTFKEEGKIELKATLEVPHELDSKYMGQIGVVPWTFIVEEIPEDDTPDTGDWFRTGVWVSVAAVLAAAIILVLLMQRRRRAED